MKMVFRHYGKKITREAFGRSGSPHLVRHPQASPFAWQSSPLRSGCRTGSQPQLICACKAKVLPSLKGQMQILHPLILHGPEDSFSPSAEPSCPWSSLLGHGLDPSALGPRGTGIQEVEGHLRQPTPALPWPPATNISESLLSCEGRV